MINIEHSDGFCPRLGVRRVLDYTFECGSSPQFTFLERWEVKILIAHRQLLSWWYFSLSGLSYAKLFAVCLYFHWPLDVPIIQQAQKVSSEPGGMGSIPIRTLAQRQYHTESMVLVRSPGWHCWLGRLADNLTPNNPTATRKRHQQALWVNRRRNCPESHNLRTIAYWLQQSKWNINDSCVISHPILSFPGTERDLRQINSPSQSLRIAAATSAVERNSKQKPSVLADFRKISVNIRIFVWKAAWSERNHQHVICLKQKSAEYVTV